MFVRFSSAFSVAENNLKFYHKRSNQNSSFMFATVKHDGSFVYELLHPTVKVVLVACSLDIFDPMFRETKRLL